MIITRTPFRISLFGGGTDYPAWFSSHGGAVLATTINKYCYISCRQLPPFFDHKHRIVYSQIEMVKDGDAISHPTVREVLRLLDQNAGVEIHHDADLPARSGLGSSSSFTVGLINAIMALNGQRTSKKALAQQAIYVEQKMTGEVVGSQDQISAAFGGFNRIDFMRDGDFNVEPIVIPRDVLNDLQSHLMLFFTGFSRLASEIAQSKVSNIPDRKQELTQIRSMVDESIALLSSGTKGLTELGRLLHEGWMLKRQLSTKVSTTEIDHIYDIARSAGALGGKLLGAGGGGFLLLYVPQDYQSHMLQKLSHLIHVPFRFESSGSRVIFYQPDGV